MRQFKEIITTKIIDEEHEEEQTIAKLHTIKYWEELTDEEKEEEIKKRQEEIYNCYQEDIYNGFLEDLDLLKEDYKDITFDTIYLDSNSHGGWIDRVKDFNCRYEGIEIYGEYIEIEDIELNIGKYINGFEIYLNEYYIDEQKLEKIKNSKRFKKWYERIKKELNDWIEDANEYCSYVLKNEYNCPSCLGIKEERDWLYNYFAGEEFETIEEI